MLKTITFHIKDNTTYSILACLITLSRLSNISFLFYIFFRLSIFLLTYFPYSYHHICYSTYFSNYHNFRCLLKNIFTNIFFSFIDMHVVFKFTFVFNLFIFLCSTRTKHCKWITGQSVKFSCSWHYSENMQDWKNFLIKGSTLFDKILDKEVH